MKRKIIVLIVCLVFPQLGFVLAQSASGTSKNVLQHKQELVEVDTDKEEIRKGEEQSKDENVDYNLDKLPAPKIVDELIAQGKFDEAISRFDEFKKRKIRKNPFDVFYLEMSLYNQMSFIESPRQHEFIGKADSLKSQLIKNYPEESDVYLLQIDWNTMGLEEILGLADKAVKADSTNMSAYEWRGRALYMLNRTKEACEDFNKLPYKNMLPEYSSCSR